MLKSTEPVARPFDALYRDNVSDIFAYAMTLVRDRAAAEDVTSLTFERAYRRHDRYDSRRGSPRAWLFGIARNASLDELRRRSRTARLVSDVPDGDSLIAVDDTDELLRRSVVRTALASLEPRDRELITLKFHAGLGNAEIGRVLGISESNAGTRLNRAVNRLRQACNA